MAEIAPGGGPNRLFVVLAVGLAGLLVLGLLGVGGVILVQRLTSSGATPAVKIAVTTPTRTQIGGAQQTPGATTAATATSVLSGASDTPTTTLVVAQLGGTSTPLVTPGTVTPTVIGAEGTTTPSTGTPGGGSLPQSGIGEDLVLLAGGVVLIMIIFAARRARTV